MRRRSAAGLAALLLFACVPAGAFLFLDLVLARGDVYPPYSSFRSDPLGTAALFSALALQPGLSVSRLHERLPSGPEARGTVVIVAGLPSESWVVPPSEDLEEVQAFLGSGGRLVLGFLPVRADPYYGRQLVARPGRQKDGAAPRAGRTQRYEPLLTDRWGVAFRFALRAPVVAARREAAASPSLPAALSWRSGLRFELRSDGWTPVYAVDGRPVVATRAFGRGTLVLLSDVSLLCNEAVRKEPAAGFLAFLVGDASRVLFDETHLGVEGHEGVMTLMRRHRLTGVVLVALLLAALFVWRSATSLLPRRDDPLADQRVAGRDSFEGLVRLLARGIPPSRLLPAALAEWSRAAGEPTDEMRRIAAGARSAAEVPAAYAALCRAAKERQRKEPHE